MHSKARTEIIQRHSAGEDAQTIFSAISVDPRHVRDIIAADANPQTSDLKGVLNSFFLLYGAASDEGPLAVAALGHSDPQIVISFKLLQANLQTVGQVIRSNQVANMGAALTGLTEVAKAAMPEHAADIQAAVDGLSGGLLFAGVTLADVQDVIAEHEAEQHRDTVLTPFLQARLAVAEEQIADGTITETSHIAAVFEVK